MGVVTQLFGVCVAVSAGIICTLATASSDSSRRCSNEYVWRGGDDNEYGYRLLKDDTCSSATICASPYPKPESTEDRVPPVEKDVEIGFFGTHLDAGHNTTCLRVQFSLSRYSASKFKGIQFSLVGFGYNSHNKDCCQILNFTTPLSYPALFYQDETGGNRRFTFDCFCDLWPSEDYKLTIRTLPVDFENQSLLDDSSVTMDIRVPDCTDRAWDQYCKQSKEELWRPQLLDIQQVFPNYTSVTVTFNIAPLDYNFVQYVVNIYECESLGYPAKTEVIDVATHRFFEARLGDLRINTTTVVFTVADSTGKCFNPGILAKCPWGQCYTPPRRSQNNVTVIANPCSFDPCGRLGSCIPDRASYNCTCNSTALYDGTTCIVNPCNGNPCGSMGVCHLNGAGYSCNCSNSLDTGKTCISNPCDPNPCDAYSTCEVDQNYRHKCKCAGVTCLVDKCDARPSSDCITTGMCNNWTNMQESRKYYDCLCAASYDHLVVSNFCTDDVCSTDACRDYWNCSYTETLFGALYSCGCLPGYTLNKDGNCSEVHDKPLLMIVLVSSILLLLLLIIGCSLCLRKHWYPRCNKMLAQLKNKTAAAPTPTTPTHTCIGSEAQHYEPVAPDDRRRVLIMYTDEHRDVVCKLAMFLQSLVQVETVLWCQHKTEIHAKGLDNWLSYETQRAFKVLFICSRGSRQIWEAGKQGIPTTIGQSEFGNAFQTMLTITKHDRATPGQKSKFLTAYFGDYSSDRDVPDVLNDLPCYNLMRNCEEMCFNLLNSEQDTPTSRRHMPAILEIDKHQEGTALLGAIKAVKLESTDSGAYSMDIPINSLELRDIPGDEGEQMSSFKIAMDITDTDSGSDEEQYSTEHSVEV